MVWRNTFKGEDGSYGFGQGCYTKLAETNDPVQYAIDTGAVGFIAYSATGDGGNYDVRGATFEADQDAVKDFTYGFDSGNQCDVINGTLTFGVGNKAIKGAHGFRGSVVGSISGNNWVFFYGGKLTEQEKTTQANTWAINKGGGGGGGGSVEPFVVHELTTPAGDLHRVISATMYENLIPGHYYEMVLTISTLISYCPFESFSCVVWYADDASFMSPLFTSSDNYLTSNAVSFSKGSDNDLIIVYAKNMRDLNYPTIKLAVRKVS